MLSLPIIGHAQFGCDGATDFAEVANAWARADPDNPPHELLQEAKNKENRRLSTELNIALRRAQENSRAVRAELKEERQRLVKSARKQHQDKFLPQKERLIEDYKIELQKHQAQMRKNGQSQQEIAQAHKAFALYQERYAANIQAINTLSAEEWRQTLQALEQSWFDGLREEQRRLEKHRDLLLKVRAQHSQRLYAITVEEARAIYDSKSFNTFLPTCAGTPIFDKNTRDLIADVGFGPPLTPREVVDRSRNFKKQRDQAKRELDLILAKASAIDREAEYVFAEMRALNGKVFSENTKERMVREVVVPGLFEIFEAHSTAKLTKTADRLVREDMTRLPDILQLVLTDALPLIQVANRVSYIATLSNALTNALRILDEESLHRRKGNLYKRASALVAESYRLKGEIDALQRDYRALRDLAEDTYGLDRVPIGF